jgi:Xaa-Pro aminopeptidase
MEFGSLAVPLSEMRSIKQNEELILLRKAITISNDAHNNIMHAVKPGWSEYEMQALGEYIFTKNGCEYTGYPCIVGSGNNSTILHYETNRRKTESGDFIEMDIGGEYHGYTADITRSFPVNGKFSPEQRTIYDLVLEAQDSGIAEAKAGNIFKAPHNAAVSVITRGLLKLGIISKPDEYKKYFMHGTSHFLGLDVHDPGNPIKPLQDRQIITVEPGIYIAEGSPCDKKWWKIGCRIEDDILITTQGPEILSRYSPRKADDIEKLMNSH